MNDQSDCRGWLRFYLDAMGSVSRANRSIALYSTRAENIEHIKCCLATIGIAAREFSHPNTKRVVIKRRIDVLRFIDEVGSGEPEKRAAMEVIRAYRPVARERHVVT